MFPLTENGREASPESVITGAAMPPSASVAEGRFTGALDVELAATDVVLGKSLEVIGTAAKIGVAVAEGGSMKTVLVTTSQVELAMLATAVGVGSTKIVLVTTEHSLSAGLVTSASFPPKVVETA